MSNSGKIRISAIVFSLAIHLVLLAAFSSTNFSVKSRQQQNRQSAVISYVMTNLTNSPIMPKPAIKESERIVFENLSIPQNQELSLFPNIPISNQNVHINQQNTDNQKNVSLELFNDTNIKFFDSSTDRKNICFVVDASGSMHGSFGLVKQKLLESIAQLEPNCYFYIIFFANDTITTFSHSWTRASPSAKKNAIEFVNKTKPFGKTNSAQALEKAIDICSLKNDKNAIFFLTDGFELDTDNPENLIMQIESYRKKNIPFLQINTLGFDIQSQDSKILVKIAEFSGGSYNVIK